MRELQQLSELQQGFRDGARRPACRFALSMMLLATLAACHAPPTRTTAAGSVPASPDSHELPDATYDWRGLLIVPFDSMLKDIPLALHEVLLFRDVGHGAAAADEAECY